MAEKNNTDIVICINKCDLAGNNKKAKGRRAAENIETLKRIYEPIYPVVCIDSIGGTGFDALKELIKGRRTASVSYTHLLDRNGEPQEYTFEDYHARVMCHEFDHLDGILYKDKAMEMYDISENEDEEH